MQDRFQHGSLSLLGFELDQILYAHPCRELAQIADMICEDV